MRVNWFYIHIKYTSILRSCILIWKLLRWNILVLVQNFLKMFFRTQVYLSLRFNIKIQIKINIFRVEVYVIGYIKLYYLKFWHIHDKRKFWNSHAFECYRIVIVTDWLMQNTLFHQIIAYNLLDLHSWVRSSM